MSMPYSGTALAAVLSIVIQPVLAVSSDELPTIVVTATRFVSDPLEQPIAAQVITDDEIRDSSATTVAEVLSKLGGVHTRINFTGVPDMPIDLRGYGFTGDQNTLVLLNGQRISENESATARLSSIPVDSIERIEVLRGAGSVLYGGGASGGTINIITRSPVVEGLTGNVSTIAGSHGMRDVRSAVRYGDGRWGLSLNAQSYENDNYRENNRAEQDAVSAEFRFGGVGDFIALGINADEQKARLPGARTEAQLASDPRGTSTPNDFLNSDSQIYSLRSEKRLGDITLALDIGQRSKSTDSLLWGVIQSHTEVDTISVAPRLQWKTRFDNIRNRLTAGVDWSDWDYESDVSGPNEKGTQKNTAFYLSNEMMFPTGTRLTLGARNEEVKQTQRDGRNDSQQKDLSAYEIALQQDLGEGFSGYGRIGKSFRVANIDENRCYPWAVPCPALLKPQRSRDSEIGLQWRGQDGDFRIGLFNMDVDDEIHYNALTFSNMNLSPTRRRGLELEGKLFVSDDVELAARYTRTEATFREGRYSGVDVTGNEVPLVPKSRASLNLGWQLTDYTRLGFNVNYVGSQTYDNDQANLFRKMPSYTVADIKLSHEFESWRLAAGINNMFDEKYYSYAIVNGTYTSFNAYPEDRRNGYVSAEYRF